MDIHQFLREVELDMLRNAQVLKEMEEGFYDNDDLNQTLNSLNILDEIADKPLNLEKISNSRRGRSNMNI